MRVAFEMMEKVVTVVEAKMVIAVVMVMTVEVAMITVEVMEVFRYRKRSDNRGL